MYCVSVSVILSLSVICPNIENKSNRADVFWEAGSPYITFCERNSKSSLAGKFSLYLASGELPFLRGTLALFINSTTRPGLSYKFNGTGFTDPPIIDVRRWNVSMMKAGNQELQIQYGGDSNYLTEKSPPVYCQINKYDVKVTFHIAFPNIGVTITPTVPTTPPLVAPTGTAILQVNGGKSLPKAVTAKNGTGKVEWTNQTSLTTGAQVLVIYNGDAIFNLGQSILYTVPV